MIYTFRGGLRLGDRHDPGYKSATSGGPIEIMPLPDEVILPVSMHIGAPAKPLVSAGDIVDMGQEICAADGPVSVPVHASVSGKVIAVEPRLHPNGTKVLSVVIENDGEDRLHESVHPYDFEAMTQEERIDAIRSAGIAGHGGATFPTHIKIQSGIGKCDTIILNGAECEPYITSDHRLLLERPEEIIGGLRLLADLMEVEIAILAIEDNKADAFPKIEELIADDPRLRLVPLQAKYPQGAEKQLIYSCTGREVPAGRLPADAGCAVFNIDTAGAVYRRFALGLPVMRRVVTVSGAAVKEPKNLEVRIGTQLERLIDACGGFKTPPCKLLMGGPMMGVAQFSLDAPVFKGTNSFLCLTEDEGAQVDEPSCIRCGRCVRVCPMSLMPLMMNNYGTAGDLDEAVRVGSMDCIECGSCAYVCPARIPLVQRFRLTKTLVMNERAAVKARAESKQSAASED